MRSVVSFELDSDWLSPSIFNDRELFFPQSIQLTHIRIRLCYFDDCICLLKQLGQQLYAFIVSIVYVDGTEFRLICKIPSVSNIH
jgi:hypothetical protein